MSITPGYSPEETMLMQAAVVTGAKRLELLQVKRPDLPEGGALIRITGCGVCGSDVEKLFYRDARPGLILGHEAVGVIEKLHAPTNLQGLSVDQRVALAHHVPCGKCHYCRFNSQSMCKTFKKTNLDPGGFSQWVAVSKAHLENTVFALEENVSDKVGSCIEPLGCCIRAVDKLPDTIGNTALVIGLGFIGVMTGQVLQKQGFRVWGTDLDEFRLQLAIQHQAIIHGIDSSQLVETLKSETEQIGVDVVFISVVNPATISLALQTVRDGGVIIPFSASTDETAHFTVNDLYFREISLVTSYSPSLSSLKKAQQLINDSEIVLEPFINGAYPLTEIEQGIADYRQGKVLKAFITI